MKSIKLKSVNFHFGFVPFEKNKDDIYLIPTIALGWVKQINGTAYGIGIKFLKLTIAIGLVFKNKGEVK